MRVRHVWLCLLFFVISFTGCKKEDETKQEVYATTPYNIDIPYGFPSIEVPEDNPLTVEGVQLGRKLYYDPILHKDEQRSCSSCHVQANSFTSAGKVLPHVNLAWSRSFLWNGKVHGKLENIMTFEVEEFFETDVTKLNNHPEYPELFKKAYGIETITTEYVAKALAQFLRTLISGNSRYDKAFRKEIFLNEQEERGYEIFFTEKGDCFHCHGGILFTDNDFHNTGMDSLGLGLAEITGNPLDEGRYKTPTLRNIEYTAPYMHDGRFATLEEVIDFYSEGVKYNPNIDPLMKYVRQGGVHLTAQEKQDLIAFLKTLSDEDFISDPRLARP